jgi:phosphohistidine phosphatase SixA
MPVVIKVALAFVVALVAPFATAADQAALTALKGGGHVILIRHALTTPGTGDPKRFTLQDCETQRNLVEEGREEARKLGRLLRKHDVKIDRVLSSPWCRSQETARLMEFGDVVLEPALNNLFGRPANRDPQIKALRPLISAWKGPGNLLLVSHGSTIGALLGIHPGTTAGAVLKPAPDTADGFSIVGRIGPEG